MLETILDDAKILYDFHNMEKKIDRADFMIVLGSHDTRAAYHALKMYKENRAEYIICAGGFGKITKKIWKVPEAVKFSEILIENGVSPSKIFIEDKSTNTGDNFIYSKEILNDFDVKFKTGIIVSKTYLSRRSYYTALKQWPEIKWYVMSPKIDFYEYPSSEVPLERMINLMVGDIQRLVVYADKGYQEKVEIPIYVKEAYKRLIEKGYNKYLIS